MENKTHCDRVAVFKGWPFLKGGCFEGFYCIGVYHFNKNNLTPTLSEERENNLK